MTILVLQGPNLNWLGRREPERYGRLTLTEIQTKLDGLAEELGVTLVHYQSNHEGALIDRLQSAADEGVRGVLVNPGGLGHSSVSLRDALVGLAVPFVEVHVSNLAAREEFRHRSLLADVAAGVVFGFGPEGYELALRGLVGRVSGAQR